MARPMRGWKAWATFGLLASAFFLLFSFYKFQYEVPILMYHRVEDVAEKSSTIVSPAAFERQMEFLKVHRYEVLSLQELLELLKKGKNVPAKAVVITFDDGTVDNVKNAFPVLKKMDFPATVFMITRNIGQPGWLSEEDLRILDAEGVSVGSHTQTHAFLPKLSEEDAEDELRESKKHLEEILGHPVTLFSYPAGGVTEPIRAMVEVLGYEGAVTTNYGKTHHDPYMLHRIKVGESSGNLFNFWIKTSGLYHLGKKRIVSE